MNNIKLRGIGLGDLGIISRIIRKMELKNEVKKLFKVVDGDVDKELLNKQLQAELVMVILENYEKAEQDIQKLISNLTGLPVNKVKELTFSDMKEILVQLDEDEKLPDFLKFALQ